MRQTPLRRQSKKVRAMFAVYGPEKEHRIRMTGRVCQMCRALCGKLDGHHYAGTKAGLNLLRFVILGRRCHDFLHANANQARKGGWLAEINGILQPNPVVRAAEARFAELTGTNYPSA